MFTFILNYRKDANGVYILSGSAPTYEEIEKALGDKAEEYFSDVSVAKSHGHFVLGMPGVGLTALDTIPTEPGAEFIFNMVQDAVRDAVTRLDNLLGVKNVLRFVDESAAV